MKSLGLKFLLFVTAVSILLSAYVTADSAVETFLAKINFQVPTDKEIEARKKAAEKAKERRANEK